MTLNTQKVSASLPICLLGFIRIYRQENQLRSDSEVITFALRKLEKEYLAECYAESQKEIETHPEIAAEAALWDTTVGDGIEPEDW